MMESSSFTVLDPASFVEKEVRFNPDADDDKVTLGVQTFSPCCSITSSSSSGTLTTLSPEIASSHCETGKTTDSHETLDEEDGYFLHHRLAIDAPLLYWDMAKNPIFSLRDTVPWDEPFALRIKNTDLIGAPVFHFRFSKTLQYPWELQAKASNGEDCSVRDAFSAIYRNLEKLASEDSALQQPIDKRRQIYHARTQRCQDLQLDPMKEPLRRIDFLCEARRFLGVSTVNMPTGWFMIQTGTISTEGFNE